MPGTWTTPCWGDWRRGSWSTSQPQPLARPWSPIGCRHSAALPPLEGWSYGQSWTMRSWPRCVKMTVVKMVMMISDEWWRWLSSRRQMDTLAPMCGWFVGRRPWGQSARSLTYWSRQSRVDTRTHTQTHTRTEFIEALICIFLCFFCQEIYWTSLRSVWRRWPQLTYWRSWTTPDPRQATSWTSTWRGSRTISRSELAETTSKPEYWLIDLHFSQRPWMHHKNRTVCFFFVFFCTQSSRYWS